MQLIDAFLGNYAGAASQLHVGAAQFSKVTSPSAALSNNMTQVRRELQAMAQQGGGTNFGPALQACRTQLQPDGHNGGHAQVCVLITDGQASDDEEAAAEKERRDGPLHAIWVKRFPGRKSPHSLDTRRCSPGAHICQSRRKSFRPIRPKFGRNRSHSAEHRGPDLARRSADTANLQCGSTSTLPEQNWPSASKAVAHYKERTGTALYLNQYRTCCASTVAVQ